MRQINNFDITLLRQLWDGRVSFKKIADEVGVSTNTIRAHVQRLIDKKILQIAGLVDPVSLPQHQLAFIGFKVAPQKAKEVVEKIRGLRGVVGCACVSGRFDILASVLFNEDFTYQKFAFEELNPIKDILFMESFFVVDGSDYQVRYVL